MKEPAYLETILRLWHSGVIQPGSITHIDVAHDRDCGMMTGDGICSCKPFVTVRRPAA